MADGIVPAIHSRLAPALAAPKGDYLAFRVGNHAVGWLDEARAARLSAFAGVFESAGGELRLADALGECAARTAAVDEVTRTLAREGLLSAWRDERYAVAAEFGAAPLVDIERAAARYFGVHTYAVHVNGLVRSSDGIAMWLARRSANKAIDPCLFDNLVWIRRARHVAQGGLGRGRHSSAHRGSGPPARQRSYLPRTAAGPATRNRFRLRLDARCELHASESGRRGFRAPAVDPGRCGGIDRCRRPRRRDHRRCKPGHPRLPASPWRARRRFSRTSRAVRAPGGGRCGRHRASLLARWVRTR